MIVVAVDVPSPESPAGRLARFEPLVKALRQGWLQGWGAQMLKFVLQMAETFHLPGEEFATSLRRLTSQQES